KLGEPCYVCGEPIARVDYEEHTVYYCPDCQTRGRVLKDRRLSRLLRWRSLHELGRVADRLDLAWLELGEPAAETLDPAAAPALQHLLSLTRRRHSRDPTVVRVRLAANVTPGLECADDARHGRRPDLLRGGELSKCSRTAEDEHGECRKARCAEAGSRILAPDVTQGVDCRRVKTVGGLECLI